MDEFKTRVTVCPCGEKVVVKRKYKLFGRIWFKGKCKKCKTKVKIRTNERDKMLFF